MAKLNFSLQGHPLPDLISKLPIFWVLFSLTFPTPWNLRIPETLRFLSSQNHFGCWRHSRAWLDSAAEGSWGWVGGQPQIWEAGSCVDRTWCCICRCRSHIDRARSHGRPGADGGLGSWLPLTRTGWLQLQLQWEEWQRRTEECDQCWQLIHIQWNYCQLLPCLIKSLDKWFTKLQFSNDCSVPWWNTHNYDCWVTAFSTHPCVERKLWGDLEIKLPR